MAMAPRLNTKLWTTRRVRMRVEVAMKKMLHWSAGIAVVILYVSTNLVFSEGRDEAPYDVIIRDGRIIDGTGSPWVSGDVAIRGDRIVAIGRLGKAAAKRVIDASGLVVSPGFIDMLGQSEMALLIDNRSLSKLSQGITTEITGEGGSIAPRDPPTRLSLQRGWGIS